ncbi:hypothetical protein BDV39DRAFT_200083 [Aspergillus sergii]|uniref:Uncharacterized protein n=1 Tax=Aspergillus sergii TaxID=1034303 RepID=A0A5N6XHR5_9EURO|nr:hypothetical protein BDV39DRAFT_200083 [Aspergillus sergii]
MENAGGMSSPCLYTATATYAFRGCVEYPTGWTFDQDEIPEYSGQVESKRKCWQTASSIGLKQSEAQISTIHTEAGKDFSSSSTPQSGHTYNAAQYLNTAEPSDVQRPDLLQYPTLPQSPMSQTTEDIAHCVNNDVYQSPFGIKPYPYDIPVNPFTGHSPASIGSFQSPRSQEYINLRPMLYRSDKLLETYEKMSCALFTLYRKRMILGESTACVYTIDGLFQCVSTLCGLLETTVPAATTLIDTAGYITNNGIFKLGLMGVSIILEIYENLLRNYQRLECPEDFDTEKASQDVSQVTCSSDNVEFASIMLRYTVMDIHLRRLQVVLEAAGLELTLDPSLSAQINETKGVLDEIAKDVGARGLSAVREDEQKLLAMVTSLIQETQFQDTLEYEEDNATRINRLAASTAQVWAEISSGIHVFNIVHRIGASLSVIADVLKSQLPPLRHNP